MKGRTVNGYHFMASGPDGSPVLRDGSPCPPAGVTLEHSGKLEMCHAGYHASARALQAVRYAPGPWVTRVRLAGRVERGDDKMVAEERTITSGPLDASAILREFAAACAYRALERYGGRLTEEQLDRCLWAADVATAISAGADIPEEERREARSAPTWPPAAAAAADAAAAAAYAAYAAAAANARRLSDSEWREAQRGEREAQAAELERMLKEAGL